MRSTLRRFYVALGLATAALALLALSLATPLLGTRADFSAYNAEWNGASQLAARLHGTGAFNPLLSAVDTGSALQIVPVPLASSPIEPATGAIVILGPRSPFSPEEQVYLRDFVTRGGIVLVADDFGTANEALAAMGATTRIEPARVLDFAFAKRPEFTVAVDLADHPLFDGVERALLNYPAALVPGAGATVLANTTDAAWLDRDTDGLRGANEPAGPFAWLATETIGAGSVIILSDPSILINGMRPLAHNERFADNLAEAIAAGRDTVVIDESHRGAVEALAFTGVRLRELPTAARLAVVAVVTALVVVVATGALSQPVARARERLAALLAVDEAPAPRRALVERVRERHPDWDETTLRTILARWEQERRGP